MGAKIRFLNEIRAKGRFFRFSILFVPLHLRYLFASIYKSGREAKVDGAWQGGNSGSKATGLNRLRAIKKPPTLLYQCLRFSYFLYTWRQLMPSRHCIHQRWSASCGLWRGGQPILCGRFSWPFSHGNRVCFFSFCWRVGMFFSLLYLFYVIILANSGCKIRHFYPINQEISHFITKLFAIFAEFHYFCTRKEGLFNLILYEYD